MSLDKPTPRVTAITRPFWEGCNAGRLMIQRCDSCGEAVFFPRACCPFCGAGSLVWEEARGRGAVVTWTFVHRPQHESFYAEAPILFAAVALEEGPIIYSRLEAAEGDSRDWTGAPVRVVFRPHAPGQLLPFFVADDARPAG